MLVLYRHIKNGNHHTGNKERPAEQGKELDGRLYPVESKDIRAHAAHFFEEIGNGIIEVIGRGVTYLYAEGAYTHQQRKVLLVVAKLTQVAKIKQIVRDIDPGCFMIIQDANDVFGKGFTSKPSAHKKNKKIFCTVDTLKQKS